MLERTERTLLAALALCLTVAFAGAGVDEVPFTKPEPDPADAGLGVASGPKPPPPAPTQTPHSGWIVVTLDFQGLPGDPIWVTGGGQVIARDVVPVEGYRRLRFAVHRSRVENLRDMRIVSRAQLLAGHWSVHPGR